MPCILRGQRDARAQDPAYRPTHPQPPVVTSRDLQTDVVYCWFLKGATNMNAGEVTAFRLVSDRCELLDMSATEQEKAMARGANEVAALVASLDPVGIAELVTGLITIGILGAVETANRTGASATEVLAAWKRDSP